MDTHAQLKLGRTIGGGTFGKVRRAIHTPTNQPVAVKILQKSKITNKKDALRIQREISILKKINHPNLLKLLQLIQTPNSFMLVTQLVEGQQLFHRINRKGGLCQDEAGEWFVQLLDATIHLKNHCIAHRDIKPENIIIEGNKLTLIDYGLGKIYQRGDKLTTSCGSHCYAAPEMMSNKSYDPQKSQVWALGVTLYAMLSGQLPFEDDNPAKLLKLMQSNNYQQISSISTAVKELLRSMLQSNPEKRWNLERIKNHKWVKAMQHQFTEINQTRWDEELLQRMKEDFMMNQQQLIKKIKEGFGEESICYYLLNQQNRQPCLLHSGPVHLKFIFNSVHSATLFINSQLPNCTWLSSFKAVKDNTLYLIKHLKGGYYYACLQHTD